MIFLFVVLFAAGIYGAPYIKQFLPNGLVGITPQQQAAVNAPTPTPTPVDPFASWKTYQVISGATKAPIAGVFFRLPPDVLAPVCDATTCMSQGTYLPGGTRFTAAARGAGQLLSDFRGSAISDVGGVVFTTTETSVSGQLAREFTGTFSGKTAGGFGFTRMHGVMVAVTPTISIELNHFTPFGITADFAADEMVFAKILQTLVLPGSVTPIPTPLATMSATPATSSGY